MAKRPVFLPIKETGKDQLVQATEIEFKWHSGMAFSQKVKNIKELHQVAATKGISPVLEISTKSDDSLGVSLSAFNLKILNSEYGDMPVESAFQGSKVFKYGGPYTDFYRMSGRDIKRDERTKRSGGLIAFQYENEEWQLEPKTAFYDWIYLKALSAKLKGNPILFQYSGFTDIEFNPKKSINCQARSCALYVALMHRDILEKALYDKHYFLEILKKDSFYQPHSSWKKQSTLFDMDQFR